jgi:FkbM family methyltransferase
MKHRQRIKAILLGTPLEEPARWVYRRLRLSQILGYDRDLGYDKQQAESYDRETIAVIERVLHTNSNCIDVGCHRGDILREILRVAPIGTHYAFEPIPYLYRRLVKHFRNVRVCQLALSDRPGVTTFHHVLNRPDYSGIRQRKYPSNDEIIEQIEVRQDTLDNVIPENVPIHFMKVDVEGAELNVLRGAVRTIQDNKPVIVFEHGLGAADFYGAKPDEVFELLSKCCGLRVSLMERWLRDEKPLDRAEFIEQFEHNINYYFIAYP